MIGLVLAGIAVLIVGWRLRRRAVARSLVAGLTADKPAFHVEPPAGRLGNRMKDTAL